MNNKSLKYVLITPARNEEAFIGNTISSVVAQNCLPEKYVVVSDGSTDKTDEIVRSFAEKYKWIQLVKLPEERERNFAAKVGSFNAGCAALEGIDYDIVGNLDADITFGEDYFQFLLEKFDDDPELGVAGTPFVEDGEHYDYRFTNIEHVSGACQLFRRQCFEEIGGYVPIKGGGIDWTAVTTARMKGWRTRTFTEKICYHHRKIGTGSNNKIVAWFKHGQKDYFLGGHPLWQLFRGFFQMKSRPFILGGLGLHLGYLWAFITRVERPVSPELIRFHRKEQMSRLKRIFKFLGRREGTSA
ncbi:MAG: glycosyltransferase family 2 protein [bacterium]|nr:glycosyltransferase family 2 protein [bacterium]